ncbi:MAG: 30S ribosomal protein S6 [Candidatus Tectomicrobia bacterium]|uniref:Small ribosomal subunit protein bS6 n=1 Tax=Tectimicrobiota bacterium TaxID=2528274 RepID=A0A932CQR5_UNCTE|nr:30S ribosomal protein S6 [Candidatus Tectomicrobia bacterium]
MYPYETIFILKPDLNEGEIEEGINRVKDLITKYNGEISKVENWGKKRLAYQIQRNRFGHYVFITFRGTSSLISELERHYKLNENILRSLMIRVDEAKLSKAALRAEKAAQRRPRGVREGEEEEATPELEGTLEESEELV